MTLQYCSGFCHTLTWISHGYTCVPHPDSPPSHLPHYPIPQAHPNAPALSTLSHASNLDWQSVSYMMICMFQCYSLKSSHPCLLPLSPKDCSIPLCLLCCLAYRVIIMVILNSTYMHAQFLIGSFIFQELSCRSCLYIFEINSLSGASFAITFSHSEGCLFTLLIASLIVHKLLSLIRSHLFIFAFISTTLGGGS